MVIMMADTLIKARTTTTPKAMKEATGPLIYRLKIENTPRGVTRILMEQQEPLRTGTAMEAPAIPVPPVALHKLAHVMSLDLMALTVKQILIMELIGALKLYAGGMEALVILNTNATRQQQPSLRHLPHLQPLVFN